MLSLEIGRCFKFQIDYMTGVGLIALARFHGESLQVNIVNLKTIYP